MANGQIFIKKILLMSVGVLLMTALVTTAKADTRITRNHQFDLSDIKEVEISSGVGDFEMVPVDGDEMRVILDLEANHHGFLRRRPDVSEMDLRVRERGDTLVLEFDERHVEADWVVEMPRVDRTTISMGVGEVHAEVVETDLVIKLGVGDVEVEAPSASVGRIHLTVGVGDAEIRGGEVVNREASFISQNVRGEGEGSYPLEVDVGVGDVHVRLD